MILGNSKVELPDGKIVFFSRIKTIGKVREMRRWADRIRWVKSHGFVIFLNEGAVRARFDTEFEAVVMRSLLSGRLEHYRDSTTT